MITHSIRLALTRDLCFQEVLDSACECFEEFLPPNWETHTLDLQHEISEGRWAVIHPSLFEEAAEGARPQFGEIKLRVRPPRNQRASRNENNGERDFSWPMNCIYRIQLEWLPRRLQLLALVQPSRLPPMIQQWHKQQQSKLQDFSVSHSYSKTPSHQFQLLATMPGAIDAAK